MEVRKDLYLCLCVLVLVCVFSVYLRPLQCKQITLSQTSLFSPEQISAYHTTQTHTNITIAHNITWYCDVKYSHQIVLGSVYGPDDVQYQTPQYHVRFINTNNIMS